MENHIGSVDKSQAPDGVSVLKKQNVFGLDERRGGVLNVVVD